MAKVWILLDKFGEIQNVYSNEKNAEGWRSFACKDAQDIFGLLEIEIDERPFPNSESH